MRLTKKLGTALQTIALSLVAAAMISLTTPGPNTLHALIPPQYAPFVAIGASALQQVLGRRAFDKNPDGTSAEVGYKP